MCTCYTKGCCCGCMERKSGIKVMTTVDLALHALCFYLMVQFQQWLYLVGHIIEVLIILNFVADILLLVAMGRFNGCFIGFWMIYRVMYIAGIFMSWIAIGNVIYHQWERRNSEMSWCIAWGCGVLAIFIYPFYNIHYFIVVKSYRKDNLSQASEPIPPVEYSARNAQIFIITRPPAYDIYGQAPPDYGQGTLTAQRPSPPPIDFFNIQGTNQILHPGGTEPLPPPYNNNKK